MTIKLKNKDMLIFEDFKLKCCIGLNGIKSKKVEGDKSTPRGLFTLGKIYYRPDRVKKPKTNISLKKITKKMGWCDDPNSKYYNSEIKINKKIKCERLFRHDYKYNYLLVINYNLNKIKRKGSAIFIHLTKNYQPTAGCVAIRKKDFLILIKLINKNTKINII
jgi:L,D-peptidoglycan transpeptidase YkuD (ErfK/YbiS/YcfS/YnhG family)|tara:strand:+ start:86 stop:574 length:489 start_codon:yes stop_codon:yes gene_type:complete